jgi:hypothetical protein
MERTTEGESARYAELGGFLKARRARLSPAEVGLPEGNRRRTPGLRREEISQLAGISLTWYTWLEQGRPIQVSSYVLECLSRAFRLDGQERLHLYALARISPPSRDPGPPERASPALWRVLDRLDPCPSMITDRRWSAVAWNAAARAVFGDFEAMDERERNVVWAVFAEDRYRALMVDWELHAKALVARFRAACEGYAEDPWLLAMVEDLRERSPEFAGWWSLHEIQANGEKTKRLDHPTAGLLDFEINSFSAADGSGLTMIVHVPRPGTGTEERIRKLLAGR